MLLLTYSCRADMQYDQFDQHRNEIVVQAYMDGVQESVLWMNAAANYNGARVYCAPRKMVMTKSQLIDILDHQMSHKGLDERRQPVPLLLIEGLIATFPCPNK
jgi:hypothetical protein